MQKLGYVTVYLVPTKLGALAYEVIYGAEKLIAGKIYRMLMKTTEYLDHFARFKRKENVEAVERLLSAHKELAKFERAQLGRFTATASILPTNLLPYSKARDLFFEKRGGQCADILHAIGS